MSKAIHFDSLNDPRRDLVAQLRRQVGTWQSAAQHDDHTFSSSIPALDRQLPGGTLRYGMLAEWLSGLAPSGAATLSLLCAREACRAGGVLVVLDRRQTFYPPAAAAWGIDLNRLLIVRPQTVRDEHWAAVQALRSPAVAALWAEIDRLDSRAFRRLQLAAEAGRTLGLLLRPASVRGQPTWADVRFAVEGKLQIANYKLKNPRFSRPLPSSGTENLQLEICNWQSSSSPIRLVHLRVLHSHGRPTATHATFAIDDTTHTVREVKERSRLSAKSSHA